MEADPRRSARNMTRLPAILLIGAAMGLAACQSEEVTRLCAATGDPAVGLSAYATDAAGRLVRLTSDGDGAQVTVTDLGTPIVADLWLDADLTFQATRRGEVSPCEGANATYMVASFDSGETQERATQCIGNALARLAGRVAESAEAALDTADLTERSLNARPESAGEACDLAHEQL
jgi:hypothetical protein